MNVGDRVDRYEVVGVLGEGGMARVYAVRHRSLGSEHALKVLTLQGADLHRRLVDEGRIQAQLHHPNVVSVTDLVDVGGYPGLVMERIRGVGLDVLLSQGRLAATDIDGLAQGIFDGVAAAHAVGLVHRDLKPGNVLVETVDGRRVPKVADFGLARTLDASSARTRTGSTMGTPCYMAPEQFRNARHAGPDSDVFALGAILYEMVTGRRAFDDDDLIRLFSAIDAGNYTDPAELAPDAPAAWCAAIRGALVSDRARRIPSVALLRDAWKTGVVAIPPPSSAPAATWSESPGHDAANPPTAIASAPSTQPPPRDWPVWIGALVAAGGLVTALIALALAAFSGAPSLPADVPNEPTASAMEPLVAEDPPVEPDDDAPRRRA